MPIKFSRNLLLQRKTLLLLLLLSSLSFYVYILNHNDAHHPHHKPSKSFLGTKFETTMGYLPEAWSHSIEEDEKEKTRRRSAPLTVKGNTTGISASDLVRREVKLPKLQRAAAAFRMRSTSLPSFAADSSEYFFNAIIEARTLNSDVVQSSPLHLTTFMFNHLLLRKPFINPFEVLNASRESWLRTIHKADLVQYHPSGMRRPEPPFYCIISHKQQQSAVKYSVPASFVPNTLHFTEDRALSHTAMVRLDILRCEMNMAASLASLSSSSSSSSSEGGENSSSSSTTTTSSSSSNSNSTTNDHSYSYSMTYEQHEQLIRQHVLDDDDISVEIRRGTESLVRFAVPWSTRSTAISSKAAEPNTSIPITTTTSTASSSDASSSSSPHASFTSPSAPRSSRFSSSNSHQGDFFVSKLDPWAISEGAALAPTRPAVKTISGIWVHVPLSSRTNDATWFERTVQIVRGMLQQSQSQPPSQSQPKSRMEESTSSQNTHRSSSSSSSSSRSSSSSSSIDLDSNIDDIAHVVVSVKEGSSPHSASGRYILSSFRDLIDAGKVSVLFAPVAAAPAVPHSSSSGSSGRGGNRDRDEQQKKNKNEKESVSVIHEKFNVGGLLCPVHLLDLIQSNFVLYFAKGLTDYVITVEDDELVTFPSTATSSSSSGTTMSASAPHATDSSSEYFIKGGATMGLAVGHYHPFCFLYLHTAAEAAYLRIITDAGFNIANFYHHDSDSSSSSSSSNSGGESIFGDSSSSSSRSSRRRYITPVSRIFYMAAGAQQMPRACLLPRQWTTCGTLSLNDSTEGNHNNNSGNDDDDRGDRGVGGEACYNNLQSSEYTSKNAVSVSAHNFDEVVLIEDGLDLQLPVLHFQSTRNTRDTNDDAQPSRVPSLVLTAPVIYSVKECSAQAVVNCSADGAHTIVATSKNVPNAGAADASLLYPGYRGGTSRTSAEVRNVQLFVERQGGGIVTLLPTNYFPKRGFLQEVNSFHMSDDTMPLPLLPLRITSLSTSFTPEIERRPVKISRLPCFSDDKSEIVVGSIIERRMDSAQLGVVAFLVSHGAVAERPDVPDARTAERVYPSVAAIRAWKKALTIMEQTVYDGSGMRIKDYDTKAAQRQQLGSGSGGGGTKMKQQQQQQQPTFKCRVRNRKYNAHLDLGEFETEDWHAAKASFVPNRQTPDGNANKKFDILRCILPAMPRRDKESLPHLLDVEIIKNGKMIIRYSIPWDTRSTGLLEVPSLKVYSSANPIPTAALSSLYREDGDYDSSSSSSSGSRSGNSGGGATGVYTYTSIPTTTTTATARTDNSKGDDVMSAVSADGVTRYSSSSTKGTSVLLHFDTEEVGDCQEGESGAAAVVRTAAAARSSSPSYTSLSHRKEKILRTYINSATDSSSDSSDSSRLIVSNSVSIDPWHSGHYPMKTIICGGIWRSPVTTANVAILLEWVQHNILIGVDHIIFGTTFSRRSTQMLTLLRALRPYLVQKKVSVLSYNTDGLDFVAHFAGAAWSDDYVHVYFDNMCLYFAKGMADYVAVWDFDEFFIPMGSNENVRDVLKSVDIIDPPTFKQMADPEYLKRVVQKGATKGSTRPRGLADEHDHPLCFLYMSAQELVQATYLPSITYARRDTATAISSNGGQQTHEHEHEHRPASVWMKDHFRHHASKKFGYRHEKSIHPTRRQYHIGLHYGGACALPYEWTDCNPTQPLDGRTTVKVNTTPAPHFDNDLELCTVANGGMRDGTGLTTHDFNERLSKKADGRLLNPETEGVLYHVHYFRTAFYRVNNPEDAVQNNRYTERFGPIVFQHLREMGLYLPLLLHGDSAYHIEHLQYRGSNINLLTSGGRRSGRIRNKDENEEGPKDEEEEKEMMNQTETRKNNNRSKKGEDSSISFVVREAHLVNMHSGSGTTDTTALGVDLGLVLSLSFIGGQQEQNQQPQEKEKKGGGEEEGEKLHHQYKEQIIELFTGKSAAVVDLVAVNSTISSQNAVKSPPPPKLSIRLSILQHHQQQTSSDGHINSDSNKDEQPQHPWQETYFDLKHLVSTSAASSNSSSSNSGNSNSGISHKKKHYSASRTIEVQILEAKDIIGVNNNRGKAGRGGGAASLCFSVLPDDFTQQLLRTANDINRAIVRVQVLKRGVAIVQSLDIAKSDLRSIFSGVAVSEKKRRNAAQPATNAHAHVNVNASVAAVADVSVHLCMSPGSTGVTSTLTRSTVALLIEFVQHHLLLGFEHIYIPVVVSRREIVEAVLKESDSRTTHTSEKQNVQVRADGGERLPSGPGGVWLALNIILRSYLEEDVVSLVAIDSGFKDGSDDDDDDGRMKTAFSQYQQQCLLLARNRGASHLTEWAVNQYFIPGQTTASTSSSSSSTTTTSTNINNEQQQRRKMEDTAAQQWILSSSFRSSTSSSIDSSEKEGVSTAASSRTSSSSSSNAASPPTNIPMNMKLTGVLPVTKVPIDQGFVRNYLLPSYSLSKSFWQGEIYQHWRQAAEAAAVAAAEPHKHRNQPQTQSTDLLSGGAVSVLSTLHQPGSGIMKDKKEKREEEKEEEETKNKKRFDFSWLYPQQSYSCREGPCSTVGIATSPSSSNGNKSVWESAASAVSSMIQAAAGVGVAKKEEKEKEEEEEEAAAEEAGSYAQQEKAKLYDFFSPLVGADSVHCDMMVSADSVSPAAAAAAPAPFNPCVDFQRYLLNKQLTAFDNHQQRRWQQNHSVTTTTTTTTTTSTRSRSRSSSSSNYSSNYNSNVYSERYFLPVYEALLHRGLDLYVDAFPSKENAAHNRQAQLQQYVPFIRVFDTRYNQQQQHYHEEENEEYIKADSSSSSSSDGRTKFSRHGTGGGAGTADVMDVFGRWSVDLSKPTDDDDGHGSNN